MDIPIKIIILFTVAQGQNADGAVLGWKNLSRLQVYINFFVLFNSGIGIGHREGKGDHIA